MHDYTVRQIHDDRMAQLVREADAYRLATLAGTPSQLYRFAHRLTSVSTISTAFRWLRARVAV